MTRGARQLQSRLAPCLTAVIVLLLAGCGGGSHKSQSKTSSSTTASTKSTGTATGTATVPAPAPSTALRETVNGSGAKGFALTASDKPKDSVILRTVLPGTATSKPAQVQLKVPSGPAKTLTVTASSHGHRVSVKLHSASGQPVTLVKLHYACLLPPEPSFCPAKHDSASKSGDQIEFSAVHGTPILLEAVVGPLTTPTPAVRTATSSVVPAYTPTQLVESLTPPAAGAAKGTADKSSGAAASTVSVKPADKVVMITHLVGTVVGAPQKTTVTIEQGPAQSVKISSQVSGGATSSAVIKSANGAPITIVLPHYVCFAAPTPTFCPAKQLKVGNHRYTLTFMASPYTPPISLIATVQAG